MSTLAAPSAAFSLRALMMFAVGLLLAFVLPGCQKYDELIEKDQQCLQAWADYEADLQRRADLVPQLVNTVKGVANYEQSTLTKITEARADATSIKLSAEDLSDPAKVKAFQDAQDKLNTGALSRLLVSNENYPKLEASGAFKDLMKQLEGTENRILRSRQQYNAAVSAYNAELGKIRGAVVNKATGQPFKPRVFFSASAGASAAPAVSF